MQAILAAVGRAGVDVVQVNLLRIYLRIACGYLDIVVLGEVCYTISNNAVFSYVPLVIAFVVGLAIVVYKTTISDCIFVKAYSTFITVDKCVMILDAIARAIGEAGIAIGAYYVVQAYIKCSLLDRDNACSVIYQLIVTKLIAYQLCSCYSHVRLIGSGIRSVAVALVGCILSVSFVAYACTVFQAYFIAVDDAVILQAYIAVYLQAILAAVGRAGVDVVQVNLLRIYLRIACGYLDIVVLGEVCYTISNNAVFSYVPLVIAFVVGLAIVVYKTTISDCIFVKAYSTFITVDKCVMILDAIARAIGEAGIAIGAYYVVQAYIKCSLLDRDNACSVIYQLIVTKLIAYQLCSCYSHVRLIGSGIRSVAVALVGCILSVSFVAYACTVFQAYFIAVDDAVILQAYIAVYLQAILAAVGRAGVDVVQVNLLRIYLRIACGYLDIVVLGEVCYILCNDTVFPCGPLVIAFVVGLVIVVYKTAIGNCTFFDAYSSFITVDKCVMILDAIACAIGEAGIAICTYYVVQAYAQLCFAYIRISIAIHYQIVVLIQACICNFYSTSPGIIAMVIRYPVACYASNCAITINCYLKVTGTIVIAVYQTGDVACAVTATGNRCIAIGAVYVTQANIQRCLAYNRLAIFFQFQLIIILQCCIVCC